MINSLLNLLSLARLELDSQEEGGPESKRGIGAIEPAPFCVSVEGFLPTCEVVF